MRRQALSADRAVIRPCRAGIQPFRDVLSAVEEGMSSFVRAGLFLEARRVRTRGVRRDWGCRQRMHVATSRGKQTANRRHVACFFAGACQVAGGRMPCPDADTLASFTRGALTGQELDAFERHLAGCEVCLRVIGELAHEEDEHDPQRATCLDPALIRRGASIGRYVVLDLLRLGRDGRRLHGLRSAARSEGGHQAPAAGRRRVEDGADAPDRSRLLREAQALARVSHPNVVAVYDVGTVGDQVFMAFERVEGELARRRG